MRNAIVAAAFALVLASPAKASDYFADVAPYDWTGVYGGVHAGFVQAMSPSTRTKSPSTAWM